MTKSVGSSPCKCRSEGEQGICNPQLGSEYNPNDVKTMFNYGMSFAPPTWESLP